LTLDSSSGWAEEARQHIAKLSVTTTSERWESTKPAFRLAFRNADITEITKVAKQFPSQVFNLTCDDLMAEWGTSELAGAHTIADTLLTSLTTIGDVIALTSGDGVIADGVSIIVHSTKEQRAALAAAHMRFGNARTAYKNGDYESARRLLTLTEDEFRHEHSPFDALSCSYEAGCLFYARRFDDVILATSLAEQGLPSTFIQARGRMNWTKGMAFLAKGNADSSLAAYHGALEAFSRFGDIESQATIEGLIAENLDYGGDVVESWRHRQRAIELISSFGNSRRTHSIFNELSDHALRNGYPATAIAVQTMLLQDALARRELALVAEGLVWRALAESRSGGGWVAANDIARAKLTLPMIVDPLLRRHTEAKIALLEAQLYVRDDPDVAIGCATAALAQFRSVGEHFRICDALLVRAQANRRASRGVEAERDLCLALDELDAQRDSFKSIPDRFRYSEMRTAVGEELVGLLIEGGAVEQALYEHERNHAVTLETLAEPESSEMRLASIRNSVATLPADVAVIVYDVDESETRIWILKRALISCARIPVSGAFIDSTTGDFVTSLAGNSALRPANDKLYEIVIQPVAIALTDVATVVFVPDASLNRLPFAALRSPSTGRYVAEEKAVVTAPSLSMLAFATRRMRQWHLKPVNAVIVSKSAPNLPTLSGGAAEILDLRQIYPNAQFLGDDVSLSQTLRAISNASIVHIAGHTKIDPSQPFDAAFAAGTVDGNLTAADVLHARFSAAPVVVLAGCSTRVSHVFGSDGPASLADAFLARGASVALASMWNVRDEAARRVLVEFHRRLNAGEPPAVALRDTQVQLIRSGCPPGTWAAFQLVGAAWT
jgi:CHAT domain-containing protein